MWRLINILPLNLSQASIKFSEITTFATALFAPHLHVFHFLIRKPLPKAHFGLFLSYFVLLHSLCFRSLSNCIYFHNYVLYPSLVLFNFPSIIFVFPRLLRRFGCRLFFDTLFANFRMPLVIWEAGWIILLLLLLLCNVHTNTYTRNLVYSLQPVLHSECTDFREQCRLKINRSNDWIFNCSEHLLNWGVLRFWQWALRNGDPFWSFSFKYCWK